MGEEGGLCCGWVELFTTALRAFVDWDFNDTKEISWFGNIGCLSLSKAKWLRQVFDMGGRCDLKVT